MLSRPRLIVPLFVLLAALLAGCGGGDGPKIVPVSGGVTIDGQPLTVRHLDWVSRQAFRVGTKQAAVAGYMYIVRGLTPGQHTIVASATFRKPAQRFRTTASITVR
jgi:hypothetical protein